MKRMSLVALAMLLSMLVACGGREDDSEGQSGGSEPVARLEISGAQISSDSEVLVQVFVYGLAIFNNEGISDELPVGTFFPSAGNHKLFVGIGTAGEEGRVWEQVEGTEDKEIVKIQLSGGAATLLESASPDPDSGFPNRTVPSDHPVWMLNLKHLAGKSVSLVPENMHGAWMTFEGYSLHTCALAMDPDFRDACLVRTESEKNLLNQDEMKALAVSEVMVLRTPLEEEAEIELSFSSGESISMPLNEQASVDAEDCNPRNGQHCAMFEGKPYRKVIDLVVRNVPESGDTKYRQMETNHAKYFREFTSPKGRPSWSIKSPGCVGSKYSPWKCMTGCMRGVQPPCWDSYLRHYYFPKLGTTSPSASDNPDDDELNPGGAMPAETTNIFDVQMCPISEYP